MSDSRSDAVEHLQVAARELIAAARSFLDAAEEMVEDRGSVERAVDTVVGEAASIVSLLTRHGASAADRARRRSGHPFDAATDDGVGGGAEVGDESDGGETVGGETVGGGTGESDGGDGAAGRPGAGSPDAGRSRPRGRSRVRRIDVE